MGPDKSWIGLETKPWVIELEKGAIKKFAAAVGSYDPIYFDEEFARGTSWGKITAPPTFCISFHPEEKSPWFQKLDFTRVLHGEQYFEYFKPLRPGEKITCSLRLTDIVSKEGKSGIMDFLTQETTGINEQGEKVFVSRVICIYRRPKENKDAFADLL